jgi:5-methylthioadenosine/S-adenosylhomocysteine deaminase
VPGLVQAHIHLCQTLFRGLAEDRPLLRWLRECIWPLEAAHDADSLRASAQLGIAELLRGGTTAILDMGTVHHTDVLFEVAAAAGLRYTGGKAMMDSGEGVPAGLLESTVASLCESDRLAERWHEAEGGRLRYAYCPRFVLSCTPDLLRSVAARTRANDLIVHSHASEQREETDAVRRLLGAPNIQVLADNGLGGPETCLAHCVWPEPREIELLSQGGANVVHCPSCNLKLASGIAPIVDYLERGVNVALGADGAASNNRLDAWEELRLASLLARLRYGPEALPACEAFELATLGGARALGLEAEIGSVKPGKWADLVILDLRAPHAAGPDDLYTQLVFSARADDVRTVLIGGRVVVEEGRLLTLDEASVLEEAREQRARLVQRAGLPAGQGNPVPT